MNDFNDPNQTQPNYGNQNEAQPVSESSVHSEPQPAGFCQNCGRPLTSDTIRKVGQAVYCEPCLAARIGAPPPGAPGYTPVNPAYTSWAAQNQAKPGPNPGLAALLGLIPGVGAMYNEQYAKGIVHLVVFAVLISLADNVNGIFGLFAVGWIFYMAIEAHHTARARRDGTPLPNPFGLNDVGERLGFGRAWPAGPSIAEVANDAAAAAAAAAAQATSQPPRQAPYQVPHQPPYQTPPPSSTSWGAAPETYAQTPFTQTPYPGTPYTAPYAPIPTPTYDPNAQRNRFPAGAIWLIGLGTIFLLATTGLFNGFRPEALIGLVVLGLGIWVFLHRMMDSGPSLANDGSAAYPMRLIRALRVSVWLDALGLGFLLDAFNILVWRHSWPFFIILAGVMSILERALYQSSMGVYAQPQPPTTPAADTPQGGN